MAGSSSELVYDVQLVAATGREQAVSLRIRRDGLWLYTRGGKEIQALPFQHIVKWLPSKLRSKDPGPDDCLDVQVETTAGKKDLRMRCADIPTVQRIIADIRTTVQGVISEHGSNKQQQQAGGNQAASGSLQRDNAPPVQQQQQQEAVGMEQASRQQQGSSIQQEQQQMQADRQQQAAEAAHQQQQQEEQAQQVHPQQQLIRPERVPLQERTVQQVHAADVQQAQESGPLQQYSMKLALPRQQQQQQTADLLTAAQQQLQHLFQQQTDSTAHHLHQQPYQQVPDPQQQLNSSSMQRQSPAKRDLPRPLVDTTGVAGSSPGRARSPMHSVSTQHAAAAIRGLSQRSVSPLQAALISKETELVLPAAAVGGSRGGPPAVDLARLGVAVAPADGWQQVGAAAAAAGSSDAAAHTRFLEELVKRLSQELAARLAAEGPAAAHGTLAAARAAAVSGAAGGDADVPLPPWIKDSRYLNPLLAAYDERLAAAQAEAAGRAQAAKDIQAQVNALVAENESLHEQLAKATTRLADASAASRAAAAAVTTDADKARFQERLELLETENDLLLAQQGELEEEMQRLVKLLQDKDAQVAHLQATATAAASNVAVLRSQLAQAEHHSAGSKELKDKVKELSAQLASETARATAAQNAASAAAAAQAAAQRDLAAAQAAGKSVHTLQADLARARSACEAAAEEASVLRVEADSLRKAMRAMEGRLAEYQAKDTEVYLRIKAAMELAEEARLERDAATSTTTALQQQLEATQARLADATRQLLGGSAADGGMGAAEVRHKLAAAEREAARTAKALSEAETKVAELQATSARLARDKASLTAELTTLRDELGCCCCGAGASTSQSPVASPLGTPGRLRAEMLSGRLQDAERQRDDVSQRLDSYKRAAARAEKDWEFERNNLHAEVQRLTRKVSAAESASTAAAAAASESRQAAAAAEAELQTLRGAAARVESELRAQLADSRAARDAEVSGLASKLERALAACDKAVADAGEMMAGKEGLLAEWKKEAQLASAKLESVLQQQACEREEQQEQLQALYQQLADTQEQVALLQQEVEATRAACCEGDLLLQEAEGRLAAAQTEAAAAQQQALQEVTGLQGQLERAQLDKHKAQRQRDNLAAKLERMLGTAPAYRAPAAAAAAAAGHGVGPAGGGAGALSTEGVQLVTGWSSSSGDSSPGKVAASAAAAAIAAAAGLMQEPAIGTEGQQQQQGYAHRQ